MSTQENIDEILEKWEYRLDQPVVRLSHGNDGREVLQIRVDMGILQLELNGRPDGTKPGGAATYLDYLMQLSIADEKFELTEPQCMEIDREFAQFYHRRVCWLQLRRFDLAVCDADHTLSLMDFCKEKSPDDQWTVTHEQYRPFVLFHRTQAAALHALGDDECAEESIEEINLGLDRMKQIFEMYDAEDQFEQDELVNRLVEMREDLRKRYDVGKTLLEQLADAVAAEEYERAANLRDLIDKRGPKL